MKKILAIFIVLSLTVSSANAFVINWLLIAVGVIPATVVGVVQTNQMDKRIDKRTKDLDKKLNSIQEEDAKDRKIRSEVIEDLLIESTKTIEKVYNILMAEINELIEEKTNTMLDKRLENYLQKLVI